MPNKLKTYRRKIKKTIREIVRLIFHTPEMNKISENSDTYWEIRKGGQFDHSLNSFQSFRAEWMTERIEDGSTLLDIASGEGKILKYIQGNKIVQATPTENSEICLNYLKKIGFKPIKMDLSDPNFFGEISRYDHVLLCEILEHLPNPEKILKLAISKTNKSVFFSVPNTGYFPYRIRLLFGRFPMQWRAHPGEHLRFWTLSDMKWWLRQLDLEERSTICCYEGIPFFKTVWPSVFAAAMIIEVKV